MDKEVVKKIKEMAKGRPYTVLRHVGNRIELMFYGDYELTIIEPEEAAASAAEKEWNKDDLPEINKMKIAELREVALDLGIQTYNLKKAELLDAIREKL